MILPHKFETREMRNYQSILEIGFIGFAIFVIVMTIIVFS